MSNVLTSSIKLDNQPFRFTKETLFEAFEHFANCDYRNDLQAFPDDFTVSTNRLILVDEDVKLSCNNPEYAYYIHFWNMQRFKSYGTGWFTGKNVFIPKNTRILISLKRVDNAKIAVSEAEKALSFSTDCSDAEVFEIDRKFYEKDTADLPSYWENAIERTVDTIASNRRAQSTNSVEFFFLADEHWLSNAQNSPKLINYLHNRCGICLMLNGGDIDGYGQSEYEINFELTDFFSRFDKTLKIFSTIGNHDFNRSKSPNESPWQSETSAYNKIFKAQERFMDTKLSIWCNYYDDVINKVRYIQFDSSRGVLDSTRRLVEKYTSELPSDWNYLLLCHVYFDYQDWSEKTKEWFCNMVDNCDATPIALFTGHLHLDKNTVLTTEKGKTVQIICTATDSHFSMQFSAKQANLLGAPFYDMVVGTDTEQLFDVVQIDLDARTVKMTRVGPGKNREYKF